MITRSEAKGFDADVIIVGGGPSGLTTACALAHGFPSAQPEGVHHQTICQASIDMTRAVAAGSCADPMSDRSTGFDAVRLQNGPFANFLVASICYPDRMDARFSIFADSALSLVRITLLGFFYPDDVKRLAVARDAEHLRLRCDQNRHSTVVDIRGMDIQSQESVRAFAMMLADPFHASRRIAFVVAANLARAQLQRVTAGRDAEFFTEIEAAEAWLAQCRCDDAHPALRSSGRC